MVYIVGIAGFIGGFFLGLFIANYLLKERSRRELLENDSLKWTYGVFVWIVAALSAYSAVITYGIFYPAP